MGRRTRWTPNTNIPEQYSPVIESAGEVEYLVSSETPVSLLVPQTLIWSGRYHHWEIRLLE